MTLRCPFPDHGRRSCAFTLVEVILAVSIAIGILVVALYFHSQAANLRAQLLEESDRISAIRLVMDRLTSELRNAFAQPQAGFSGSATSLRFVTTGSPSRSTFTVPSRRGAGPRTDLRLVTYGLARTLDGTNEVATGLNRTEQPLVEKPLSKSAFATPLVPVVPDSTNAPVRSAEPMSDAIRFLRIWYWDGYGWSATWESDQLPRGIEITLGSDPLPQDAPLADYPGELFRRVISLPTSREIDDPFEGFDSSEAESSVAAPTP